MLVDCEDTRFSAMLRGHRAERELMRIRALKAADVKKTRQNKEIEPPFRFNRNGKASGLADFLPTAPPARGRRMFNTRCR